MAPLQGHEASIVILSLVRGNKRNQVGFLKDKCRQVVALSRQRCGLYIIGHMEFLQKASPSVWKVRDCLFPPPPPPLFHMSMLPPTNFQPIIEICKKERNVSIGSSIVIKAGPEATYQCSTPEELEEHVYVTMVLCMCTSPWYCACATYFHTPFMDF